MLKRKNVKSAAWNFFGLKANEHGVSILSAKHWPICKICYKSVPCNSGNTKNLFAHLRKQHLENTKKQIRVFKEIKTKTNKHQEVKVCNQHLSPGAQAKELNHAVAYFLAKHMQPMYTVEKPGFQKMIAKFHPTVGTSSPRESISPRLYNQLKETVVNPKLSQTDFFSGTTDL